MVASQLAEVGGYVRRASVSAARRVSLVGEDLESTLAKHGDLGVNHLLTTGTNIRDTVVSLVSGATSKSDEDDSISDDGSPAPSEADYKRVRRRSNGSVSLGENSYLKRREKVLELFGLGDPYVERTRWQEFQRKIGLEDLRIRIAIKQLEVKEHEPRSPAIYNLVHDMRFELAVGVMIVLNAITLGWDSFYRRGDERPELLLAADHIFTVIFMVEWLLRIVAFTWVWIISNSMNTFDTVLIWGAGVGVNWLLPLVGIEAELLQNIGCLRILRLARLCRCIRLVPFFRELWILVQGLMECSRLLFWTWIIVGSIHFVFGVAVVDLVAKSDKFSDPEGELYEHVQYYFGSLASAMITLFQIMTFDSWGSIVRPIIQELPMSFPLFVFYAGVSGIVLFNMMTAIVVHEAFERVKTDVEAVDYWNHEKERKVKESLVQMFNDMDEDGSGWLSKDEFTDVLDDVEFVRKMKVLDIDLEELPDVFEIIDDGDGQIEQAEFIHGLMWMQGNALNRDILKASQLMKRYSDGFLAVEGEMTDCVHIGTSEIEAYLDSVSEDGEALSRMCGSVIHSLNELGIIRLYEATVGHLPPAPTAVVDEDALERNRREAARSKDDAANNKDGARVRRPSKVSRALSGEMLMPVPLQMLENWSAKTGTEMKKKVSMAMQKMQTLRGAADPNDSIADVMFGFEGAWATLGLQMRRYTTDPEELPTCIAALPPTLASLPPAPKRRQKAQLKDRSMTSQPSEGGAGDSDGDERQEQKGPEAPAEEPPALAPPAPARRELHPPQPATASIPRMSVDGDDEGSVDSPASVSVTSPRDFQEKRARRQSISLRVGALPEMQRTRQPSVAINVVLAESKEEPAMDRRPLRKRRGSASVLELPGEVPNLPVDGKKGSLQMATPVDTSAGDGAAHSTVL
mmetsp:Transcript_6687/g.14641  ORF Transcript_6687/g.14641 Transcript_6687/m.14641 type:complete len:913 (+) Transcript_6687:62-2800(+)